MGIFILIELLLLFGKEFSKFNLVGSLYLYDLLLLGLTFYSGILFIKRKDKILIWPLVALIGFSIIYLIYSFANDLGPLSYIVRQYALFVYLVCAFLIYFSYCSKESIHNDISLIVLIGGVSVILQIGFHIYNFIFVEDYQKILFTDFNYYSLLGIMGIISFLGYVLIFVSNKILKWTLALLVLFLATTMGHHSSAFLSVFTLILLYLFIRSGKYVKVGLLLILLISGIAFYFYVPQFQDHNSLWRMIYWKLTLRDLVYDYYALLGHGFGGPYISQEIMDVMRTKIDSPWFEVRPEEQFITPMHNSFITIAYHIGLIPSFLVFIPILKPLGYFFSFDKEKKRDKKLDFLLLTFIGVTIWSSFHVVLELPHSSLFYWFIYFVTFYYFFKVYNSTIPNSD